MEDPEQVYLFSIYIRIIFFYNFFLVNYLSGKRAFVFGFFFVNEKVWCFHTFFYFFDLDGYFFLVYRNCCKIGFLPSTVRELDRINRERYICMCVMRLKIVVVLSHLTCHLVVTFSLKMLMDGLKSIGTKAAHKMLVDGVYWIVKTVQ